MFPRCAPSVLLTLLATPLLAAQDAPLADGLGGPLPPRAVARLGSSRLRHGGWIYKFAFSPDGRNLASWGGEFPVSDGIAVWEVATGRELRRVVKPGMWLNAWAWLPDGRLLGVLESKAVRFMNLWDDMVVDAAGGSTGLWDMTTGKHLRQLIGSDPVRELAAFTAAGELVIVDDARLLGDQDRKKFPHGVVHVVDASTGTQKRIFPAPRDISALALSPDGRTAYLGSPEGTIDVCDLVSGVIGLSLAGHHDRVTDLALVPGGQRLVTTSRDGSALVWDLSARPANARKGHERANE